MSETAYRQLWEKIDQFFTTAPKDSKGDPHPAFMEYLKLLYSPEEAMLLQHLGRPGTFSPSEDLANASGVPVSAVEEKLDSVYRRNGIVAMGNYYSLPPMPLLVNIHQFYPEVKQDDLEAARLHSRYFIDGKFYRYYETSEKGTPVFRTIPVNKAIQADQKVLSAEEAHDFILNHAPEELALVPCPCRTRTEKMGVRECSDKNPIASCIMMGPTALHFEALNLGTRVTRRQAVEYFDEMQKHGLVGQTDNTISDSSIICMCCGCCCSQLRGRTRWDNMNALLPANFIPMAGEDCVACETCTERCYFQALSVNDETGRISADPEKCIGCGLCTMVCPEDTLKLVRMERSTPFPTSRELIKTMALENREGRT